MRSDSIIEDLMKTILNLAIAFEKQYIEKFVENRIVNIIKDMISSDFFTEMIAHSYY